MHKKLQTLVTSGIILSNTLFSSGNIFADSMSQKSKSMKLEKTIENTSSDNVGNEVPEDEWQKTTRDNLAQLWEYDEPEDGDTIILNKYRETNHNKKVEIPREIDGKAVELENLNSDMFPNVTHIKVAKGDKPIKLRSNSLFYAFGNNQIIQYVDLRGIDTSNLTSLQQTFQQCHRLEYLNLSGWNVEKVTSIAWILYDANSLKTLNLSGWNLKADTDNTIFAYDKKLNNLILRDMPSKSSFDKITEGVAASNSYTINLDITGFNLASGETSLSGLFNRCYSRIVSIKGLDSIDITNVTDISSMFKGCSNLTSIDGLEGWNTENLQNMGDMFDGCSSLTDMSAIENWDTSNVTMMNGIFNGCSGLTSLDLSKWNTEKVTNLNGTFLNCTNLENIQFGDNWKINKVTQMNNTFNNCKKLHFIDLTGWTTESNPQMTDTFKTSSDVEDRRLLVVTDDSRISSYSFRNNNLLPVKATFDANEGSFGSDNSKQKYSTERFTITPSEAQDIDTLINTDIESIEKPTREGYTFVGWEPTIEANTLLEKLNMTYTALWKDQEDNITIPGEDGVITIKPSPDGQAPIRDTEGNVIIPDGGSIKLPNDGATIKVPGGGTVNKDGSITLSQEGATVELTNGGSVQLPSGGVINTDNGSIELQNGGNITLPSSGVTVSVPEGATVNPNGTIEIPNTQTTINQNGEIIILEENGENITIPPMENGQVPTIDSEGNVTISGGGSIKLPNDIGTITVPGGGTVNKDGSITIPQEGATIEFTDGGSVQLPSGDVINTDNGSIELQNGGNIKLPNNGVTVTVPEGTTVNSNGTIEIPNTQTTINQNGEIIISGEDGENITIPPMENGQIPTIDTEGNVTIPGGGSIKLPNDIGTIKVPGGGTVNKDGSITVPTEGGTIELPIGTIDLPSGSTVKPNGSVELPNSDVIINPDGEITLSGESGETITIPPVRNEYGNVVLPEINENGDITLTNGGTIELPNIDVVVPNGSIINQNGTITVPNKGEVTLSNYETTIEVPSGTTINPDGSVIIPNGGNITISGKDNNNITINSGTNGQVPTIDSEGNVIIPDGGSIKLPNVGATIKVPGGGTVNKDGSITIPQEGAIIEFTDGGSVQLPSGDVINTDNGSIELQNGGNITLPSIGVTVTVPEGTTVNPNGTIEIPNTQTTINQNGEIIISGENGENITIPPMENGQVPTIDTEGNVVVPEGGQVILPKDAGTVIVPEGSIVKPNGSIIVSNEGKVTLPSGKTVTVKPGTIINQDGTINEEESKPAINDKIDTEVVDIVGGDGQENNPLVLSVKADVTSSKLNTFLNGLNDLNPKVTSILRAKDYTQYKLEVNNSDMSVNKILKIRSTSKTTHVTIKVDNTKTDLIKALNKYSRGTNANVTIPSIVKFTDVSDKFWAKSGIEDFASMGLINGYSDGSFKPNNSITRAEFVKIINSAFGYTQKGDVNFSDVKPKDWFYNEVAIARQAGYINGKTATTFAPNDPITRQEVSKILTTIMKKKDTDYDELKKFPDGNKVSDWAKPYVEGAIEAGYLGGDSNGNLNPDKNITRAEAVTVLSRIKK